MPNTRTGKSSPDYEHLRVRDYLLEIFVLAQHIKIQTIRTEGSLKSGRSSFTDKEADPRLQTYSYRQREDQDTAVTLPAMILIALPLLHGILEECIVRTEVT